MTSTLEIERQTLTVPDAGRLLGLSRNGAYAAASRGEIPTIRLGRKLFVPKYRLLELLEGDDEKATAGA